MLGMPRQISIQTRSDETEMEPVLPERHYHNRLPDPTVLQELAQNGRRRGFDQTLVAGLYGYMAGMGIAASTSPMADKLAVVAGVTVSLLSVVGLLGTTYRDREHYDSGYKLLIKNILVAGVVGLLGYSAAVHKDC